MALAIHVPGPTLVKVDAGLGAGLEDLGYTIDGVDVEFTAMTGEIPGDQNGGSEGPPIDVQFFGEMARIRTEFSRFDEAVVDKIRVRVNSATLGTNAAPGSLMIATSYRLLLVPTDVTYAMNFPIALCRNPITSNVGTKFQRLSMDWEAHPNLSTRLLWDTTTV